MAKNNPKLGRDARDRKLAIEREGFVVQSWSHTGRTHVKFQVEMPDGTTRGVIVPGTGSDPRGLKDMLALVRRFAAECPAKP